MDSQSPEQLKSRLEAGFDDIISLLGALGNPNRLRILISLLSDFRTFKQLSEVTSLKKSALASHLQVLRDLKLLLKIEHGTYQLTDEGRRYLWVLGQLFEEPRDLEITRQRTRVVKGFLDRKTQ
jgi:DNA-binding transcriptional ArsR family regulator